MSELCTTEQVAQCQSMIGSLQWIVTIGRFDIHTVVMTMSGFCINPEIGHLERLRHIWLLIENEVRVNSHQEQRNLIIQIYRTTSMIGRMQYMAIPKKCYQMMHPNRSANM
jgi:hypothetical protein